MYQQLVLMQDKYSKSMNLSIYKIIQVYCKPFSKKKMIDKNIVYAVCCNDNTIDAIRYIFNDRYIPRLDIGANYYYGNVKKMIKDIDNINKKIQKQESLV